MKTVWKYELPLQQDHHVLNLLPDAKVLHVAAVRDRLFLWAMGNRTCEDPKHEWTEKRRFLVVGTGFEIHDRIIAHIGTGLLFDGGLVLHVFEVTP